MTGNPEKVITRDHNKLRNILLEISRILMVGSYALGHIGISIPRLYSKI